MGSSSEAHRSSNSRVVPILMPEFGNEMEEGTILAWKVSEGDRVAAGDVICEIETDKAVMEYEVPESGRLARIVAHADDTVPVQRPIAYLAETDADVDAFLAKRSDVAPKTETTSAAPAPTTATSAPSSHTLSAPLLDAPAAGRRFKASPAARMIAAEEGIDLSGLRPGSGPGGRIISSDLPRPRKV